VRVLVPGASVIVASDPLLSYLVSGALSRAGLERRGEIVRLVMTMRGGDRPKHAHVEFADVSVMPRSMWEPWLMFRKPLEGRAQDNLREWGTGGFRRISADKPFGDVIESAPTRAAQRCIAPHPSLKALAFLRKLVRGVLPLGTSVVLDPFAGSGSTPAAANAVGYESIGVEKDASYFKAAKEALPKLSAMKVNGDFSCGSTAPPALRVVFISTPSSAALTLSLAQAPLTTRSGCPLKTRFFLGQRARMLGKACGEHVRQDAGYDRRPQHVIEPLQPLLDETRIDVEKEVVHILHRELEVVEPQFIRQRRFAIEFRLVDRLACNGHRYLPDASFNDTARVNTGRCAV
jgi:hypothetical protein